MTAKSIRDRDLPTRATQGFVGTLSYVWWRPQLTLIEIAWRWAFGIPALWLAWREGTRILTAVPWRATGIAGLSLNQLLTDPLRSSAILASFASLIMPAVAHSAIWLLPLLLIAWTLLSTIGRSALLRSMDRNLQSNFGSLLLLQTLRVLAVVLTGALWIGGMRGLAQAFILGPVESDGEPSIMLYVGGTIVLSLGLFVVAGAIGWIFNAAPVYAMRDRSGALKSLRDATLSPVRGGMLEINMVLSVVKIMLLVLATAFSAFPTPFASVISPEMLLFWTGLIGVWYLAASDYFHVTRIAGFLRLIERHELTHSGRLASE